MNAHCIRPALDVQVSAHADLGVGVGVDMESAPLHSRLVCIQDGYRAIALQNVGINKNLEYLCQQAVSDRSPFSLSSLLA